MREFDDSGDWDYRDVEAARTPVAPIPNRPQWDDTRAAAILAEAAEQNPMLSKAAPPSPMESLNSEVLLASLSSLSDEALDDQVKELCLRRRRNDEALAALVYEKNFRLAKAGRDGEFAAWYSRPDIDLKKRTAYDMIHRHAANHGLPLPWDFKAVNSTEPYYSTDFELNEDYGKPVSDPQADLIRAEVKTQQARRVGLAKSRIVRVNLVAETAEQKDQIKSGLEELGTDAAPQIHKMLHPFRFMLQLLMPDKALPPELERRSIYPLLQKENK